MNEWLWTVQDEGKMRDLRARTKSDVTLAATTDATKRKLSIFSQHAGRLCLPRLIKLQIVDPNQFRQAEGNT